MSATPVRSRLVLVEGTIGAGKTTTAQAVTEALRARGASVRLVLEGAEENPADVDDAAYDLPLEEHVRVRLEAWRRFVTDAARGDDVWVVDCAVVQNPVTVAFVRDGDADAARGLVHELLALAAPLEPVLLRLVVDDVAAAFEAVVAERPTWWLESVVAYYSEGVPGAAARARGATARAATLEVLAQRARLEEQTVADLQVPTVRVERHLGRAARSLETPIGVVVQHALGTPAAPGPASDGDG